ncbi:unnamed protein product [Periconia digitata]|uniref:Uncharacterized protein n=1 Tax=Periconia digitata TaxID=1303443 RepID=A0A9W4UAI5_9PLEO|nr:unnamed protein product [Periconia digitata]
MARYTLPTSALRCLLSFDLSLICDPSFSFTTSAIGLKRWTLTLKQLSAQSSPLSTKSQRTYILVTYMCTQLLNCTDLVPARRPPKYTVLDHLIVNIPSHTRRVLYLKPAMVLAPQIHIVDLTNSVYLPSHGLTGTYRYYVRKTMKRHSLIPDWTCYKHQWPGLNYSIRNAAGDHVAKWKRQGGFKRKVTLDCYDESTHSPHAILVRDEHWYSNNQKFTVNSQTYLWEVDSFWARRKMTLYRICNVGFQTKIAVAKCAVYRWGGGSVVVVDDRNVDVLVACLTISIMLQKMRERG